MSLLLAYQVLVGAVTGITGLLLSADASVGCKFRQAAIVHLPGDACGPTICSVAKLLD